jgi:uncharacterized protein YyaL (SSP411 family)
VAADAIASPLVSVRPSKSGVHEGAIYAGVRWLCLTHDVTGRQGSSKAFSLVHGWQPPYPETTGYIIRTLLDYARRTGQSEYFERAQQMGDWELDVQNDDGGVMEGTLSGPRRPSIVFNTGMVIHGWVDLYEAGSNSAYLDAAERAGSFLVAHQDDDGAWRGQVEYSRIPHTYNSCVAWALLRLADATGEGRFRTAALRQLNWVLSMQGDDGWFEACVFKPGMLPSTHGIGYTLSGLLESYCSSGREAYLSAVVKTSEVLIRRLAVFGWLPGSFARSWEPAARYECLTGNAQLGAVWLRLFGVTGDARFLNAGLKAVELAAGRQVRLPCGVVHGALPGSYPIYGRYAPLQFPNWATKFLVDALMLREDVIAAAQGA